MSDIDDITEDFDEKSEPELPFAASEMKKTPKKPSKKTPKKPSTPKGMAKILIEEHEDIPPNGLYVGVNGRGYLIRAGVPVDVPLAVLDVLEHAEMSRPIVDPVTRRVTGYVQRLRYPFRKL